MVKFGQITVKLVLQYYLKHREAVLIVVEFGRFAVNLGLQYSL